MKGKEVEKKIRKLERRKERRIGGVKEGKDRYKRGRKEKDEIEKERRRYER